MFELSHVHTCVQCLSGYVATTLANLVSKPPAFLGRAFRGSLSMYLGRQDSSPLPFCLQVPAEPRPGVLGRGPPHSPRVTQPIARPHV